MAVARHAERCASGNESCPHAGGNWRHYRGRADPYLLERDARKAWSSAITQIDPEILIIDEMLTVGDFDFQKKYRAEINVFRKRGVTLVFVLLNIDEIATVCDRVIWIEDHRMCLCGSPDEIIREYAQG